MRTIKFRVWDTKTKQFLEDVPCVEQWLDSEDWDDAEQLMEDPYFWQTAPTFNGRLVWHQEVIDGIYEGDIIEFYCDYGEGPPERYKGSVVYDSANMRYGAFHPEHFPYGMLGQFTGPGMIVKVIGNIFETTE